MLRLNSHYLTAFGLLFCSTLLSAQDDVPTFRADSRLVVLHASVVDKGGKLAAPQHPDLNAHATCLIQS